MKIAEAKFCVNTPLFMSGANPNEPEIRITSIKGMIRYWWRALNYATYVKGENKSLDLKKLKEQEEFIFGSTNKQSNIRFSLKEKNITKICKIGNSISPSKNSKNSSGLVYLGYGVVEQTGDLSKACIANATFSIKIVMKDMTIDSNKYTEAFNSVIHAVKIFGLIGGIGQKSRKGYGSVNLISLNVNKDDWVVPTSIEEYKEKINQLLNSKSVSNCYPAYTAFSRHSSINVILEKGSSAMSVLNNYGERMMQYRSWGFKNKSGNYILPNQKSAEQNFKDDHDWFRVPGWATNHNGFHPRRAIFGLPHNYFARSPQQQASIKPQNYERRASPLFFHVHNLGAENYIGVSILLPAEFLPEEEMMNVNGELVAVRSDGYQDIKDFLNGNGRHNANKQYFGNIEKIWPRGIVSE